MTLEVASSTNCGTADGYQKSGPAKHLGCIKSIKNSWDKLPTWWIYRPQPGEWIPDVTEPTINTSGGDSMGTSTEKPKKKGNSKRTHEATWPDFSRGFLRIKSRKPMEIQSEKGPGGSSGW